MGAWSQGSFDNDSALDAIEELIDSIGLGLVESWFLKCGRLFNEGNSIDVDLGSSVVVGAEVVAMLRGNPSGKAPENLTQWLSTHQSLNLEALTLKEAGGLYLVTEEPMSELKVLWEERDPTEWYTAIDDLKKRIDFDTHIRKLALEGAKKSQ